MEKLPGLQAARAVAALSIAYFHSWEALTRFPKETAFPLPILTNYGWLAVDLFFALSGFVICLVASKPTFNPIPFLTKRIFRLYPLWLVTLTTFALLTTIWRGPTQGETFGYFLYSATLLPTQDFPYYGIGWSLQHEMAFYLLTAIIVPFAGLFGLAAFLVISTIAFHTIEMPWYLSSLAMYHAEFLAGIAAFLVRDKIRMSGLPIVAIGVFLLVFLMYLSRYYVPVALFFLILGFSKIPAPKNIVVLGDASYSIYLIHPIVFLSMSAVTSKIDLPLWIQEPIRLLCFLIIIAASLLSWRYFERSIMTRSTKFVALAPGV